MRWTLILGSALAAVAFASWPGAVSSQPEKKPSGDIERDKLFLAGWDPDEPVPAYLYYKKGNKGMPVVIFLHGMGGSKEQYSGTHA